MNKGRFIDAAFMLLAFGLFWIISNVDKDFESYNIVSRHGWLLLIMAYYIGRWVSPFVKSLQTGVKIPKNYDYKKEYRDYLENKYK